MDSHSGEQFHSSSSSSRSSGAISIPCGDRRAESMAETGGRDASALVCARCALLTWATSSQCTWAPSMRHVAHTMKVLGPKPAHE